MAANAVASDSNVIEIRGYPSDRCMTVVAGSPTGDVCDRR